MTVRTLLLPIRTRLQDEFTSDAEFKWEDDELIDIINSSILRISRDSNFFIKECELLRNNDNLFFLPENMFYVISICVNSTLYNIKNYSLHIDDVSYKYATISYDGIRINPNPLDSDKISIKYKYALNIVYIDEIISLPILFKDAIIFCALHMANQKIVRDNSLKISEYYRNLYQQEIDKLTSITYSAQSSHNKQTKYKKV